MNQTPMNVCIQKWYGRLGNNLIQLKNALHIALFFHFNVQFPKHPLFSIDYIVLNKNITRGENCLTSRHDFFYVDKLEISKSNNSVVVVDMATIFKNNTKQAIDILKMVFVYNCVAMSSLKRPPFDVVVIHMRSGDIFDKNPHEKYIMPPLSYYKNILNANVFHTVILVAQDTKNPCILALLKLFPTIQFKIQSLEKDIKLILEATHIVVSFGTFVPSLLLLSNNVQHIYNPSYQSIDKVHFHANKIQIHETDLTKYRAQMIPWKNTPEQIQTMIHW